MNVAAARIAGRRLPQPAAEGVRSGFTLLEMLLVLAVLAAAVAVSWPNMLGLIQHHTLASNVEEVRACLDRARVAAIEEGRTMQVRFEIAGRRYVFLPEAAFTGSMNVTLDENKRNATRREPFRVSTLPEGLNFYINPNDPVAATPAQVQQLTDPWLQYLQNPQEAGGVAWTPPILFFPDGTATDGKTILVNKAEQAVQVWVRGLTGAVAQSKMRSVQELNSVSN